MHHSILRTSTTTAIASWIVLSASCLTARAESVSLGVGDDAPKFEVLDDQGEPWKSSEHFGKKIVVVYFYPADMTGGCTAQACAFRDDLGKLSDKDVEVVGVSGDTVESHQLFKKAHSLNFTLLADVDGVVADAFGVPKTVGEKTVKALIDGETYDLVRNVTTKRWTFIVDRDGKIAYKDDAVNAGDDSARVLAAVEKLK
jgi:thioredoxin-dependent peroxiredoxin